jgi:hypothetical protein
VVHGLRNMENPKYTSLSPNIKLYIQYIMPNRASTCSLCKYPVYFCLYWEFYSRVRSKIKLFPTFNVSH